MEIAFHSLIRGLITWLLVSSTFCDIAVQPNFETTGQFAHFPQYLPDNNYNYAPNPRYSIPQFGQFGQMPINNQQNPQLNHQFPNSYGPQVFQFRQPAPLPTYLNTQNQMQSLDSEIQKNLELQRKASDQMIRIGQGYPYPQYSQVYPYPQYYGQPPNNPRSYRSLPILQSQGYRIIKLQGLQNPEQDSWSNLMDSGHDFGVNSQTYNSQFHKMAENSSLISSQFGLNNSEFNKKVDDYIVGSPLQIHKPQSLIPEQHHPVDIVNIPDDFESPKNKSNEKTELNSVTENYRNFSTADQPISSSSNKNRKFTKQNNNSIENSTEATRSRFINQPSSYKDYARLSKVKNNDRPISNIQLPFSNEKHNYNQPQGFEPELGPQRSYISQTDLMNSQTSKLSAMPSYQKKSDNDFYNSYKNYPSVNMWQSPKFLFTPFNYPYNTATNSANKELSSW